MAHVLQLIDSLALGGLERVAVDLANGLARASLGTHSSSLCATRLGGPLEQELEGTVPSLILGRRSTWDLRAARRCARWAADADVDILHAHGSSIWFGNLLLLTWPAGTLKPRLLWHDHFGRFQIEPRNRWLYRVLTAKAAAVLSVNEMLKDWAIEELGKDSAHCHYVPNSIDLSRYSAAPQDPDGADGRPLVVVCLANLRQQKNHQLLIEAFAHVRAQKPELAIELQLIGSAPEDGVKEALERQVEALELGASVHLLGERTDVPQLLQAADIGVLSSSSEGLPLALLEYGGASLAVTATAVGQIPQVIRNESMGLLVNPGSATALGDALIQLASDAVLRRRLGSALKQRVERDFSQEATLASVLAIYESLT